MPIDLAAEITAQSSVPVIGIGAGPHCDGQILVTEDMTGLFTDFKPKFVKRYAELGNKGAKEIGFADMGALWRSGYDMTPEAFEAVSAVTSQVCPAMSTE